VVVEGGLLPPLSLYFLHTIICITPIITGAKQEKLNMVFFSIRVWAAVAVPSLTHRCQGQRWFDDDSIRSIHHACYGFSTKGMFHI